MPFCSYLNVGQVGQVEQYIIAAEAMLLDSVNVSIALHALRLGSFARLQFAWLQAPSATSPVGCWLHPWHALVSRLPRSVCMVARSLTHHSHA